MKSLEYEAKQILARSAVPIPNATLIKKGSLPHLLFPVVLKSQVPVGGRGKAGGIKIAHTPLEATTFIANLFAQEIKGHFPRCLLAEELLEIRAEHYLALLIDRSEAEIRLIAHKNGGVEVEKNTDDFLNVPIDSTTVSERAHEVGRLFGYTVSSDLAELASFISHLYASFTESDATLIEINPLVCTEKGTFIAGDCKMECDDAAAFRHPEWDFEDAPSDSNFVTLNKNGTIATIANGAGLAMATVDAVAASGMTPANFLDIGGGATTKSVLAAFEQIQEFPNVRAIVINIFAGITRCDQIARAIIETKQHTALLPPLFIRLAGTNFEEAVALLATEDIYTLDTLEDCLRAAKEIIRE